MTDVLDTNTFLLVSLIFARTMGFVLLNPVFGRASIPNPIKIIIAMALMMALYPSARLADNVTAVGSIGFIALILKEFAVGYVVGFVMRLYEFIVVYAGGVIDYEMGLSMSAIYDRQNGQQIPLSGNLIQVFYYLIFFAVDAHLSIVRILYDFSAINGYGALTLGTNIAQAIIDLFLSCVVMAIRFAMPIIVLQLLTEIAEGILMKVIPSINVFVINLQMKILIGILILCFLTSPIFEYLNNLVTGLSADLIKILKLFAI